MSPLVLALALVAQQSPATPQQIQTWFEAGQYQQVVDAAAQVAQPEARFLVALSHERLGQLDDARRVFSELSSSGDTDPWALIGRSARALVVPQGAAPDPAALDEAQNSIQQAVQTLAPAGQAGTGSTWAFANYQLGQVLTYRRDYAQAAEAFERSIEANSTFAYAHYYAGMSYRETGRIDQMAIRFNRFLELAPDAPERVRVRALMRAVRGR